ncbi:sulfatase family protein [Crateriforma conspicua]|uniref:sulfatase family protein n=1 Tax=Crateriforma conspicua TaxID=2527996 RepID=UPI00118B0687|nr:sulfatase-like hydrolase/transferase [Crateriforma conspicua]QDV61912.1 Arylsulfatase [Crateriforma conspicua]
MPSRTFISSVAFAIVGIGALFATDVINANDSIAGDDTSRPNILVIMCDDLGYADVGFNGSTDIQTPNLDALAKAGTVCTSGYVAHPFCGPSRMGMMSGRYPHQFGAPFNLPNSGQGADAYVEHGIDPDEVLISTVMQRSGYFTAAVGKWHMGIQSSFHPNHRGFEEYYGFLGGGHKYFPQQFQGVYERQKARGIQHINEYVRPLEHNGRPVKETEYVTDGLSREAVRIIHNAATDDRPFFMFLAYNAPHTPLEAKPEDMAPFAHIGDEKRRTYAGMVFAVDRGVGQIVDALSETSQLNDTLIVFLSDNGGKTSAGADNGPLREGKGSTFEGGYRVPMFFHWPGVVNAGQTYPHPITALDFYPTFAALADASIPDGKVLDGKNVWASLINGDNPRPDEMIYAMRHRQGFSDVGARRGPWKITRTFRSPWKLFNLEQDLSESRDLIQQYPDVAAAMIEQTKQWSSTHPRPLWFDNRKAESEWTKLEMPRHNETFAFERPGQPAGQP